MKDNKFRDLNNPGIANFNNAFSNLQTYAILLLVKSKN